jgi:purine-binding chemotaxis protein CheW
MNTNTYLSFTISNELYAVNVTNVLEVLQKQRITVVPNTPDFIKGIINFRGDIVPVYETRTKFNISERASDEIFVIVVFDLNMGGDNIKIGAIVDKVKDVITVNDNEIKPVPPMSKDFNTEFLSGIVRKDEHFIMLLNVHKVFNEKEIVSLNLNVDTEVV